MSEFRTTTRWQADGRPFTYDTYGRDHEAALGSGQTVAMSSAPDYLGSASRSNPEELLVAALSSCHMLTFLAIAARKRKPVASYTCEAVGHLDKDADGQLAVTRIVLRPTVQFVDGPPSADELEKLHHLAHKNCFIAHSIRATVTVE